MGMGMVIGNALRRGIAHSAEEQASCRGPLDDPRARDKRAAESAQDCTYNVPPHAERTQIELAASGECCSLAVPGN